MKYFIITGASRGLGRSLAKKIIDAGRCLFCISRQADTDVKEREERAPGLPNLIFDPSNTGGIPGPARPIGTRIAGFLRSAFSAQPKVYDPDIVAEGLVREDSFGSRLYVDFEDKAPARKPGRLHDRPVDALRRLARAAIVGTAGVFRRSVAGRDGGRVSPYLSRPSARLTRPAVRPRRKVLVMPLCTSRLLIRQVHPDWCLPSGTSCSSQLLMSPSDHVIPFTEA